jgi:hypothetical protein
MVQCTENTSSFLTVQAAFFFYLCLFRYYVAIGDSDLKIQY